MRLSVFLVFLVWSLDKLLRPDHAAAVFEHFYFIGGLGHGAVYVIGFIQLIVSICFLVGFQKKWTYGAIFIMHFISTVSSYKQYMEPLEAPNILFFAAWPMLAACFGLYLLRDHDTLWVLR